MVPIAVEPHNTQYINSLLSVFELLQPWHFKILDLALYRLCCINRKTKLQIDQSIITVDNFTLMFDLSTIKLEALIFIPIII